MTLQDVLHFRVPRDIVDQSEARLRQAGRDGYELFVLWSGKLRGDVFTVETPHIPKQKSYRTHGHELLVRVEGEALHQLNSWLFEAGELLGVQVHSHPTNAFHSDTDNNFAMVTTLGGLSIVVPDFADRGVFTRGTAVYRLHSHGWVDQDSAIVEVV